MSASVCVFPGPSYCNPPTHGFKLLYVEGREFHQTCSEPHQSIPAFQERVIHVKGKVIDVLVRTVKIHGL